MVETIRTVVSVPAEETVKNTVKVNALKKRVALDVQESSLQFVLRKELPMIILVTLNVPKTNSSKMGLVTFHSKNKCLRVLLTTPSWKSFSSSIRATFESD